MLVSSLVQLDFFLHGVIATILFICLVFSLFFKRFYLFIHETHTHTEAEAQAEEEAGSMQGA